MTDTQQSDTETTTASPRPRRRLPGWVFVAIGALVAVVAVVLLRSGGEGDAAAKRDLSTPQGAAEAFALSAAAGDVEGVLAATCLGDTGCATEHGNGVTSEGIRAAQKVIADNVRQLGGRFQYAEFTTVRDGAQPGTREVDYRLPGVPEDQRNYLVFVKYQDRWLYIASGGPTTTSPAPAN